MRNNALSRRSRLTITQSTQISFCCQVSFKHAPAGFLVHRLATFPQKRYEERYAHVGSGLGVLFTTSALDGREVLDENYSCSCQSSVFTLSLTRVWEGESIQERRSATYFSFASCSQKGNVKLEISRSQSTLHGRGSWSKSSP